MKEPLPIKEIFIEGIRMPFARYRELIRLGAPYAILFLASAFLPEEAEFSALGFASGALLTLTGVLWIVGCHRVFLLPADIVQETPAARWSIMETEYLLSTIGIALLSALVTFPIFIVHFALPEIALFANGENRILMVIVTVVMFVPAYYFMSRWSLILPGIAIDTDRTVSWAWSVSSGYSFRLFVLIGALPVLTDFCLSYILALFGPSIILNILHNLVWLVVATIEICFLSLSYEWIVDRLEPEN